MKMTLSQMAAKVGKSERTVLRWINGEVEKVRLKAEDLGNGMYEVDALDLQRLSKHEFSTSALDALERIEENQRAIITRLERLESLLAERGPALPVKQIAPPSAPREKARAGPDAQKPEIATPALFEVSSDVPEGSIHLNDLAAEIGRSNKTLYGHVKSGKYQAKPVPKVNRPGEHDWYFTPAEADRVRADYAPD